MWVLLMLPRFGGANHANGHNDRSRHCEVGISGARHIPLFDSPEGERVVLGGDMNITTATSPSTPELQRYEAILKAVESLGLQNLAETAAERPPQLENCLCGASSCHHLRTYGDNPGSQLDWLFATPELARRCSHLRIGCGHVSSLSDHAPVIAEFEIPLGIPTRHWDPESFVQEVGIRHGAAARRVTEEIIAWAQRKHVQIRAQHPYASLDRLPTSNGPDPELWVQLDLRYPERLGWTISLSANDGSVTLQFQYMKAPPFDTVEARKRMYDAIAALPGVNIEEHLTGRPSFPNFHGGRGEPARLALSIGGIPFEDDRVAPSDWLARKPDTPFGTLPVLEVDGQTLAQSNAINRYVGKLTDLYPSDAWQAALCDEVMEAVEDINTKLAATFFLPEEPPPALTPFAGPRTHCPSVCTTVCLSCLCRRTMIAGSIARQA